LAFSDIALKILEERYYLRDKDNNLLEHTPEDVFKRVAEYIALAEQNYNHKDKDKIEDVFFKAMINKELMPASPILFNAGTKNPMLSSCFGFKVEDSIESILKTLTDSAIIFKRGGGCGWNMSSLRGKGALLSSGGTSSGVNSFISLYDIMIETIKQGGRRRGAGAVILDATHPDILDFIKFKRNGGWTNINISVICTDDFMSKIDTEYKYIWDEIIQSNWQEGDPNVIFIDTANKVNMLPTRPIVTVNPCFVENTQVTLSDGITTKKIKDIILGEEIQTYNILKDKIEKNKVLWSGKTGTKEVVKSLFQNIKNTVETISIIHTYDHPFYVIGKNIDYFKSVRVGDYVKTNMNNLFKCIGQENYGIEDVYDITVENNHNFFANNILVHNCHEIIMENYASCNLAGINLDKCIKGSKENIKTDWDKLGKLVKLGHRFLDDMIDVNFYPLPEIKDAALKTRRQGLYVFGLAPALIKLGLRYGSQESLDYINNLFTFINRVSIETCVKLGKIRGDFPEFKDSLYYGKYKHMRCSHRLTIAPSGTTSRIADSYFSIEPYYAFDYTSNIMNTSFEEKIDIKEEYQDLYPDAVVTAYDITPKEHLAVLATIQPLIDQSISKTINVVNNTTPEEISAIFKSAYKLGLKCVTTFRDGCKGDQVLEIKRNEPIQCKSGVCEI
jgi:ribonucleoside-diphosphate reductase alpha chain